jgi:RNA polymerase sigma-70 factor (ECF subfamily)
VAVERALVELLPRVRRWLCRLLGPGAELDDATQDTLTELAKAFRQFEGRASLSTLAYRVTIRTAYRHMGRRARRREASLELVPDPIDAVDPESRAIHRQTLRSLYRVLDRLPKKRRVAFVLCAVEGLDPSEAAELEGVSAVAMRSRLMHARSEVLRRMSSDPHLATLMEGRAQ